MRLILILVTGIFQISCSPIEPVMSKAGVMTHPECAKFSTEEAVATWPACRDLSEGASLILLSLAYDPDRLKEQTTFGPPYPIPPPAARCRAYVLTWPPGAYDIGAPGVRANV